MGRYSFLALFAIAIVSSGFLGYLGYRDATRPVIEAPMASTVIPDTVVFLAYAPDVAQQILGESLGYSPRCTDVVRVWGAPEQPDRRYPTTSVICRADLVAQVDR